MPAAVSPTYRAAMLACAPLIRGWGRLEVSGLEHIPAHGPVLLAVNHDSQWDPVAVGVAALGRRQIRALAKASLWKVRGLGPILNGMGQIPIERGKGDGNAMEAATRELREGACLGIFPEGTVTRGKVLRARSGLGRLLTAVPQATVVCVAVTGTVDLGRFPTRPRIRVAAFPPPSGPRRDGEDAAAYTQRLLDDLRAITPIEHAGRKR
jgi:1-acyl-sn-glycerol-3-phosphate acyltransferase